MNIQYPSRKYRRIAKNQDGQHSGGETEIWEECFFFDSGVEYFRCFEFDPLCPECDRALLLVLYQRQGVSAHGLPSFYAVQEFPVKMEMLGSGSRVVLSDDGRPTRTSMVMRMTRQDISGPQDEAVDDQ